MLTKIQELISFDGKPPLEMAKQVIFGLNTEGQIKPIELVAKKKTGYTEISEKGKGNNKYILFLKRLKGNWSEWVLAKRTSENV
jgi:hypothetical protein